MGFLVSGGGGASEAFFDEFFKALDSTVDSDTHDAFVRVGDYLGFIFKKLMPEGDSSWNSPTNALYSIPSGKRLMHVALSGILDHNNRRMRFRDVTNNLDLIPSTEFDSKELITWRFEDGDLGDGSIENWAGPIDVEFQIQNAGTSAARVVGGWLICREIDV